MSHFTANQLHLIEWLATTKYDRQPPTQEALADKLGVRRETLSRWKQLPELKLAVVKRARELLGDDLPEVYAALGREAIKGSFQHIKLILELTGEYTDKIKVVSWQDELLDLLREGSITKEDIENELGSDLAQEFFESAGVHYAGLGPLEAESASTE